MKTITIGRSSLCDIVVSDAAISRVHAEINYEQGQYVFRNLGKNGSTLHGVSMSNTPIYVSPGAPILLANRVPLPWVQVYALLPVSEEINNVENAKVENYVGLCILSFIIPLVGFILYFTERNTFPRKSTQCLKWAGIGFAVNLLSAFYLTL